MSLPGKLSNDRSRDPAALRRARGMSLVEVLVSVVIFGIGIVATAQCLLCGFFLSRTATQTGTAMLYAQAAMENIISVGSPGSGSVTTTSITDQNLPAGAKQTITIVTYLSTLNLVEITVDVSWKGPSKKLRHVIVQSVLPNRIQPNT